MLTTKEQMDSFAADVCKKMEHFTITHRVMAYQRRVIKRRFERFVIERRTELRKRIQHQLAQIERISKRAVDWTAGTKRFFSKYYSITQAVGEGNQSNEVFCERFTAGDVRNTLDEATAHIEKYRVICRLMIHLEEQAKTAAAAMAKDY